MASGLTYSAREIAEALGVTERGARKRALREGWPRALVRVQGGDACAYPADGLPDDVRAVLAPAAGAAEQGPVSSSPSPAVSAYEAAPEYNRAIADERFATLKAWWDWYAERSDEPLMESRPAFLAAWADRHPNGKSISLSSLLRWEKAYKEQGLPGLVPEYGKTAGRTTISDVVQKYFLAVYLDENQRSIAYCREIVIWALKNDGIEAHVPSEDTFQRFVRSYDQGSLVYNREGLTAWRNKIAPFLQRTFEHQESNDTWVADHKLFDVLCRDTTPGEAFRPWLSAWFDQRSRLCVGWNIHKGPNSDTVLLSFRHAALERGLPREWYVDNGADYASDAITKGHKRRRKRKSDKTDAREHQWQSLAERAGVEKVRFAIPGTPRAKIIERFFLTVKLHFDKLFGSFTGGSTTEKPERLKVERKKWETLPTIEELAGKFNDWVRYQYNRAPHEDLHWECPEAVWAANLKVMRKASADRMRHMMLKSERPRVLRANGVLLHGVWYDADELKSLRGRKVCVRYDPSDMSRVEVYDTSDRFLCEATNRAIARHGLDHEMVREAARERQALERKMKAGEAARAQLLKGQDVIDKFLNARKADALANPIPIPAVPTELVVPKRPAEPADPGAPSAPVVTLAERRPVPDSPSTETDDDLSPAAMRRLMAKTLQEMAHGDIL